MSERKTLMEMNTDDFNTMRGMLSEIELKIMHLPPLKQREFYKYVQYVICEAYEDACNPEDKFLYT